MTTKNWPDPTRRKFITSAIVAVLAAPALYLIGVWAFIAEWLGMGWRLLAASTLVPNWLGLFAICSVIVAGWLGASLRPERERRRPSPIRAQDTIFNMQWRWSYDSSGNVQEPRPYCLRCGHRLVLKEVSGNRPADRYECRCDNCGALACEIDCSIEELENRVLRKIHEAAG